MKLALFSAVLVFVSLDSVAAQLPFEFEFGSSKSDVKYEVLSPGQEQLCTLEDIVNHYFSYYPHDEKSRAWKDKIDADLFKYSVRFDHDLEDLRNQKGREEFLLHTGVYSSWIQEDAAPHVKRLFKERIDSVQYRKAKAIVGNLFSSDEFQDFLNYEPPTLEIQTIHYKVPRGIVCAQYKDEKLIQLGLNKNGFKQDFSKITKAVIKKYDGKKEVFKVNGYNSIETACGRRNAENCTITSF
ncbi:hypothetical protein, partial [Oleiphilus sp. HI0123]